MLEVEDVALRDETCSKGLEEDYMEGSETLDILRRKVALTCFGGEGSQTLALVHREHFVVAGPGRDRHAWQEGEVGPGRPRR